MPLKINDNILPPGGWRFKDATGVQHVGHDFPSLVAILTNYRETAGLPPGSPAAEITAAICKRSPQVCSGGPNIPPALKALAVYVANFISKASLAVSRTGPRATVSDPAVAARRLNTCKQCVHCVDWSKGCGSCQTGTDVVLGNAVIPHTITPSSEKLACELARDSIAISMFDAAPAPVKDAPEFCWRRGGQS